MSLYDPSLFVQMNVFVDSAAHRYGTYGPVNLSAAIPESEGPPIDWWVRGPVAGGLGSALRKNGGGSLITVTQVNADAPANNSTILDSQSDAGMFSWSDGPAGHVTGSNDQHLQRFQSDNYNGGWLVQAPVLQWPDWYFLRVWHYSVQRREEFTALLNDTIASNGGTVVITGGDATNPQQNKDWVPTRPLVTQVKFCARQLGCTLSYKIRSLYEFNQGIQAAALYKAAVNVFSPGGYKRGLILNGALGGLGGRA